MANLRVNEITTGIGSYHGSIYASGTGAYLLTTVTAPGTDDFTIECYINSDNASGTNQEGVFAINAQSGGFQSGTSNQIRLVQGRDGTDGQNGGLEVDIVGTTIGTGDGNDIIQEGTWHHVAVTRASGTVKIWVDGVEKASGSAAGNVTGTTFITGYYDSGYTYQGFMSNFRYRKGTAHYTTTFTAPTKPLERTTDTELIFAQSPHNAANGFSSAIHGGITDIMQVNGNVTANASSPTQLSDTSGVGVVFNGPIKQNTQGYMYFPTGRTDERGRGRGVLSGGRSNHAMQFINIQSQGNSQIFGDSITGGGIEGFAVGSSTRGLFSGRLSPVGNVIEFITFATTSNGTDFGDMTTGRRSGAGAGNETRGLFGGGLNNSGTTLNTIEFSTIPTLGNSTDFGDLTQARDQLAGVSDTTRAVFAGGVEQSGSQHNIIDFVTIATTGNAQDFGDMTAVNTGSAGSSDSTRGVIVVGNNAGSMLNTIDFITIQSAGNAQDFGDLTQARYLSANMSNSIRAVIAGGGTPSAQNTIDFVTIKTTGDAIDFGDLIGGANFVVVGTSDSHGGLS